MTTSGAAASGDGELPAARKWAITFCVMLVTTMQILDTSVTNVALPYMQGSLSAGVEEITWVLTSYLAANAIVIPAAGWLMALTGRRRFFLLVTTLFTASSVLSGLAPNLTVLIVARVFQGLGGGPIIPLAQTVMWEIFPLHQRGMAMAVWGIGIMMGPVLGPTLGGWIVDNWSWRWIFYINLPIGVLAFLLGGLFIHDSPFHTRPGRVDWPGLVLMVIGFGAIQFVLDRGEREDWFESNLIWSLAVVGGAALLLFLVRELTAEQPILDLTVFRDRNFAVGTAVATAVGFGMYSGMLLVALYTQKVLRYDAWTAGMVLAPAGLGNMITLIIAGRLVAHVDQRGLLALGCVLNAVGAYYMADVTLGVDYWHLVWPRFVQGVGTGFTFVPLTTMTLAMVPRPQLPNATACFNTARNIGGSFGIALAATWLSRRSQQHQSTLAAHLTVWDPETTARLRALTEHFAAHGADPFSAERQAMGALYRSLVEQSQVLAYADDFWVLAVLFAAVLVAIPLFHRVRTEPVEARAAARDPAPVAAE